MPTPTMAGRWMLRVGALILTTYAVGFLVHPPLLGILVGFTHHSPNTLVEVMAFYGGLELGLALWMVWAAADDRRLNAGLMLTFFVFFAAGLGRAVGILRFGFEDPSQPTVTVLELVWSLVALGIARRLSGEPGE